MVGATSFTFVIENVMVVASQYPKSFKNASLVFRSTSVAVTVKL